MAGASFTNAASLVTTLMQNVSRNGSLLLNLTQRGRGDFDDALVQIARDIGAWLDDLTTSDTPGAVWTATFTGVGVAVYAPREQGAGRLDVQIDGQTRATADLSAAGARQAQQRVAEVTGLEPGTHVLSIVNRGPGPVAVDAIVVR